MARLPNISVLVVGSGQGNSTDLIEPLLEHKKIHYSIICSNLLDYQLPPKIENGATIWYRNELQGLMKKISAESYQLSDSLRELLLQNDRLGLDDSDLALGNHMNQIELNSPSLDQVYEILLKEIKIKNLTIHPLVNNNSPLLAFKNKKYAPLRYYYETKKLLKEDPPARSDKTKRKYEDKQLVIENFDQLKTIKLGEKSQKAMNQSDLIIILPSDIISFNILLKSTDLENQIKKLDTPIVLLWNFKADREPSDIEEELSKVMETGSTLDDLAADIANLIDYIIIDKSDKDYVDELREAGCHILVEDLSETFVNNPESLIQSIFNIANISFEKVIKEDRVNKASETKSEKITEESTIGTEPKPIEKKGKRIDQLLESPQEAGESKIKSGTISEKAVTIKTRKAESVKIESVVEEVQKVASSSNDDEKKVNEVTKPTFRPKDDEEWVDTVTSAIGYLFSDTDHPAFDWLSEQSKADNDNEVQIASEVIKFWLNSRSTLDRKRGAEIISKIAHVGRDTYLQVMQKEMASAVLERQEDKRRKLVSMFNLLTEEDSSLTESLIKGLVKQLTIQTDDRPFILERIKITIVQLVINSKKLTKVTINELLSLLDKDNTAAPQIWNILTTFDAGSVAIELVTNFSISKADEIIRRANFLRFTGSVYKILQEVLKSLQTCDKSGISEATSEILPEETLRKFDRLELARKVQKLKMVQLNTLAESLGKDVETVERLVTELIVNDELKAEMKLIDEKMYLVAEQEVKPSN